MYDIDPNLAGNYNQAKVASFIKANELPKVDGQFEALLKNVRKVRGPKAGDIYKFKFQVTKSSNESVPVGAVYEESFYPGANDVDNMQFWEKVTPLLMAASGESNPVTFNALNQLGEFSNLSKPDEKGVATDLDLAFSISRVLEPCKPNKTTGEIKHKNPDGSPKIFARNFYGVVSGS